MIDREKVTGYLETVIEHYFTVTGGFEQAKIFPDFYKFQMSSPQLDQAFAVLNMDVKRKVAQIMETIVEDEGNADSAFELNFFVNKWKITYHRVSRKFYFTRMFSANELKEIIKNNNKFLKKQMLVTIKNMSDNHFEDFVVDNGYNIHKIKLLTGLIYLNMSPLHHDPFDHLLFFLGKNIIHKELRK